MFCPRCGQKQLSDGVRFCSSCGFQLEVVSQLLPTSGQLHWRPPEPAAGQLTPRQKGIRQGAILLASTFLIVPVLGILSDLIGFPDELVGLAAVICFIGGILRMLYARFLQEGPPPVMQPVMAPPYVPPAVPPNYLGTPAQNTTLPPAQHQPPAASFRPQRFDTGELVNPPPSVVDHTTRLLDKKTPDEPPDK